MDSEVHLLYPFTPVHAAQGNINWKIFRDETEKFDDSDMRALSFVGLKPSIINKMYASPSSLVSNPTTSAGHRAAR